MRIAFDTDGVIVDTEKFQFKYGIHYFKKKFLKAYNNTHDIKIKLSDVKDSDVIINPNGYGIKEVFGCSDAEEKKFWTKFMLKYTFFFKPNKEVVSILKQLHYDGDQIFSFSSKAKTNEKSLQGAIMRTLLKTYYKLWKIPFDQIKYFSVENSGKEKKDACQELSIGVMVEDKKENIQDISQDSTTLVICKTTNNNLDFATKYRFNDEDTHALYRFIQNHKIENHPFEILSRFEREKLSQSELIDYYKRLREYYIQTTFNRPTLNKKAQNYRAVTSISKPIFDRIVKHEVIDVDKIPEGNGFILSFNHTDYIDTPLIMSIFNRPINVLAKQELDKELVGKILKFIGSIPLDRNNSESRKFATDELIRIILNGGNILVSPEGTRNKTSELLLPFDGHGTVSIAQKTGRPIILFAISKCDKDGKSRLVRICDPVEVGINDNLEKANNYMRDLLIDGLIKNQKLLNEQGRAYIKK